MLSSIFPPKPSIFFLSFLFPLLIRHSPGRLGLWKHLSIGLRLGSSLRVAGKACTGRSAHVKQYMRVCQTHSPVWTKLCSRDLPQGRTFILCRVRSGISAALFDEIPDNRHLLCLVMTRYQQLNIIQYYKLLTEM